MGVVAICAKESLRHKGGDKEDTEKGKEGRICEGTEKGQNQITCPVSSVVYKQHLVRESLFLFLFVSCDIRILIVLHKAPLPNISVCEGTEKEISVLLCDLCVCGFVRLEKGCVCVCVSVCVRDPQTC